MRAIVMPTRGGPEVLTIAELADPVVPLDTALSWTDLVAVPEAYASAWAGLHQNLDLHAGQTVVVRGPVRVFGFDDIVEAHRVMESGTAGGRMVVAVAP